MTSRSASTDAAATLAANVLRARTDLGLTQGELAAKLGLSDDMAISRWERGKHKPTLTNLTGLASLRGVDVAWFYVEHEQVAA